MRSQQMLTKITDLKIVRYFAFGCVAASVQIILLVAFVEVGGLAETLSSTLAFSVAVIVSYTLQRNFTFKSSGKHGAAFPKFVAISLGGCLLNFIVMSMLLYYVHYIVAQILALFIVFLYNFEGNRRFVF